MSEWLKEHAWKLIPLARADTHQIASTQVPSTTFHNNDARRCVPSNDIVRQGLTGVCDTVLTQPHSRVTPAGAQVQNEGAMSARLSFVPGVRRTNAAAQRDHIDDLIPTNG